MYRYIQISTVYLYHKTSYDNATYYIGFAPLFTQGLKHGLIKYPAQAGLRAFSHFSLFPLPGLQQGSQTYQTASILLSMFHTFIYLQGSQTQIKQISTAAKLCTFIYLQGSQTVSYISSYVLVLCTFIYLQGSQTYSDSTYVSKMLCTFIYLQGSQTYGHVL